MCLCVRVCVFLCGSFCVRNSEDNEDVDEVRFAPLPRYMAAVSGRDLETTNTNVCGCVHTPDTHTACYSGCVITVW